NDISISKAEQLDFAIPASKIAGLSSGEFVGMVADDPGEKIKLKAFHCEVLNDHENLEKESVAYKKLPVICKVTANMVHDNYVRVKKEVDDLIERQICLLVNTPEAE